VCASSSAGSGGGEIVSADSLGDAANGLRNFAFASFWVQLPLTIVSACILIFAVLYSRAVCELRLATQWTWSLDARDSSARGPSARPALAQTCPVHRLS
jgi:hypothetical protein